MEWTQFIIFVVLFGFVTYMGFVAARWKSGSSLDHLDEWGLGGRKFGAWVTWFLVLVSLAFLVSNVLADRRNSVVSLALLIASYPVYRIARRKT